MGYICVDAPQHAGVVTRDMRLTRSELKEELERIVGGLVCQLTELRSQIIKQVCCVQCAANWFSCC